MVGSLRSTFALAAIVAASNAFAALELGAPFADMAALRGVESGEWSAYWHGRRH